jgi:NTE family protein
MEGTKLLNKINLALGGGGTKGFAHIGVIRQLEKEGFQIAAIAGTSAGGIVGALYALGHTTKEIEEFSKRLDYSQMFFRGDGDAPSLLGLGGLHKLIDEIIGTAEFCESEIDFATTAVDIQSGQEIILNSGSIADAVKATTAVPGIFPSWQHGDLYLVDGGVLDPVPVSTARWLNPAHPVIAINLTPLMSQWENIPRIDVPPYIPIPNFLVAQFNQLRLGKAMHIFIDSIEIMTNTIAELRLKIEKPDVIIHPDVHQYTMFDKVDIDELIHLGEQAVIEARDQINEAFTFGGYVNRWFKSSKPPGKLIMEFD